jgi:uncharacterized membrane protein
MRTGKKSEQKHSRSVWKTKLFYLINKNVYIIQCPGSYNGIEYIMLGFTAEAQQAVKRALPDRDGIHMNNIRNLNGMQL